MQVQGPTIIVQTSTVSTQEGGVNSLKRLGITQAIFGTLSILFSIVSLALSSGRYGYYEFTVYGPNSSHGFWSGLVLIINGIVAIRISIYSINYRYLSTVIMSVISGLIALGAFILSAASANDTRLEDLGIGIIVMHAIVCVLNFAAMIVSIVLACLYCRNDDSTQQMAYVPPQGITFPQINDEQPISVIGGQPVVIQTPHLPEYNAQCENQPPVNPAHYVNVPHNEATLLEGTQVYEEIEDLPPEYTP